jgi:hypothetical protein
MLRLRAGAHAQGRLSIAREQKSSLLPPLSGISAPSFLSRLRAKRDGFHIGATHVKRLAAVDASEPTVAAQPMRACKSVTFTMRTRNKFHLGHVGQHRCQGLNEAKPICGKSAKRINHDGWRNCRSAINQMYEARVSHNQTEKIRASFVAFSPPVERRKRYVGWNLREFS